jgi:AP-1 complex subunit mu
MRLSTIIINCIVLFVLCYHLNHHQQRYAPEVNSVVWKVKQFQGGKEYLMQAHFGLSTITQPGENEIRHHPPISVMLLLFVCLSVCRCCCLFLIVVVVLIVVAQVRFEVPYFTVSGIQVRYLKIVERSGYTALPWVRYITQSGDYSIRT